VVLLDLPGSAGEQAAKELGATFAAADITDTEGVEAALDAARLPGRPGVLHTGDLGAFDDAGRL
jgi:hypothetical protein